MNRTPFFRIGAFFDGSFDRLRVPTFANAIRIACGQELRLPFDPFACAQYVGVRVHRRQLPPGVAGKLEFQNGFFRVSLRAADEHVRRRFTLCHELVHVCLSSCDLESGFREAPAHGERTREQLEEVLCDRIAAELLMPAWDFSNRAKTIWRATGGSPVLSDLAELARVYEVSATAAAVRLSQLRLWNGRIPVLPNRLGLKPDIRDRTTNPLLAHINNFDDVRKYATEAGHS